MSAHCDRSERFSTPSLQKRKFKTALVTFVAKTDFANLMKERIETQEASFSRHRNRIETKLADTKQLPNEALTDITAL